jgi:hypothetical protein
MVEIVSDRPLFKTILVEMAYSVIHLHNRVIGLCLFKTILVEMVYSVIHLHNRVNKSRTLMIKNAKKMGEKKQPAAFEPCASKFQTLP